MTPIQAQFKYSMLKLNLIVSDKYLLSIIFSSLQKHTLKDWSLQKCHFSLDLNSSHKTATAWHNFDHSW